MRKVNTQKPEKAGFLRIFRHMPPPQRCFMADRLRDLDVFGQPSFLIFQPCFDCRVPLLGKPAVAPGGWYFPSAVVALEEAGSCAHAGQAVP
jgi:hypothetical protein